MADDEFDCASTILAGSVIGRSARRAIEAFLAATPQSRACGVYWRVRDAIDGTAYADRFRIAGITIAVATLTQWILVRLSAPIVRPAEHPLVRLAFLGAGLVLIAGAPALARSWPRSRIAHVLAEVRGVAS